MNSQGEPSASLLLGNNKNVVGVDASAADTCNKYPVKTSHDMPNITLRRSERIRERLIREQGAINRSQYTHQIDENETKQQGQERQKEKRRRQSRSALRQRERRREESEQAKHERQAKDALHKRDQRREESEQAKHERQAKDALHKREQRGEESEEAKDERQTKDALHKRERRQHETQETRQGRQSKNAIHQRNRRHQSPSAYCIALRDKVAPESYLGYMDTVCHHCDSLHFLRECTSNRKDEFKNCCHFGSVQLPDLLPYPEEMRKLLEGIDSQSKIFREHIRNYNSALAFASMGAQVELPEGSGPYCFRIHGQIYHRIGSLHPDVGQKAQFGQLYILDSSLALKERMENAANTNCDETIMKNLGDILRNVSPFAAAFKMMQEVEQDEMNRLKQGNHNLPVLRMIFDINREVHLNKRYNLPVENEVAAIFVGENSEVPTYRHIAIYPRNQGLQTISILHPHCDPMTYPILFPCGDQGWYPEIDKTDQPKTRTRKRNRVSMLQFYSYRLAVRKTFSAIHYGCKLFQQYIVDAYVKTEQNRLAFHRQNQKVLRVEFYQGLMDHIASDAAIGGLKPGRIIILPSTFQGSPRAMQQNYQDAMAIVRKYGKPDIFLTFTCNPAWKEIQENLFPGQTPSDRPDLITRVFKLKLNELIDDIFKKHIFGRTTAHVFVIEFQKRGLPHCHLLLILANEDKPKDENHIDQIVSSEIPDRVTFPELFDCVKRHMIHGPCGVLNQHSPCMQDGQCSKEFPKEFQLETVANRDGYPRYRRPDNGLTINVNNWEIDNRWIVPYNPYLLTKFNAHINVEICASVKSIKYLFKYIYKGHDCARVTLQQPIPEETGAVRNTLEWDEIKAHLDARYVSAPEAAWRLFEFPMHDKSHAIVRLAVHLPHQQPVYFAEGNEQQALEAASRKDTTLTAWFALNSKDSNARKYHYHDIPEYYVFERNGSWKKRIQGDAVIGRMYSVSPSDIERYYLRLLLINVSGACSFDDLKTVDGQICQTFFDACKKRGLLHDDAEYEKCMFEAVTFQMPNQLRILFSIIILFCNPTNPLHLWNLFKTYMAEDFTQRMSAEAAESMTFFVIDEKLREQGRSCMDFGIPSPSSAVFTLETKHIDKEEELRIGRKMYTDLNEDQRRAADEILAIYQNKSINNGISCFFIDGPGGTGKTYLYNTLYHLLMGQGIRVSAVAWTGIAASLLPDGRTVHSRFKLPVPLLPMSTSSIRPNSKEADEIRMTHVIIWDEAPMAPCYALDAVDILLRDIMNINEPFGRKTIILGGDFRQVLPVIRFANRSDLIAASLKSSNLWSHFKIIRLNQNMRTGPGEEEFSKWLMKLGNGEIASTENDEIELPISCILGNNSNLVDAIFGQNISVENISNLCNRIILCPKNEHCLLVNEEVLQRLPGTEKLYTSIDDMECDEGDEISNYPTEFLNSLTPSGMPPHKLRLKIGAIVMLLRNLDVHQGLCNGVRLIVRRLFSHTIDCEIVTGSNKQNRVLIPRITLTPSDTFLPFKLRRHQFPVRLSFAMTINKSQGQTFDRLGLLLPQPVFSHGQLYVAFSRVHSLDSIKVKIITKEKNTDKCKTKNIVFKEIL